jgi:hypothetical protein
MKQRGWERVTAIAGILTIVLLLAELFTWGNPEFTDSVARIKSIFVANQRMSFVSLELALWSILPLTIFAAGVRIALRRSEEEQGMMSAVFFGSALVFASAQIPFAALSAALALDAAHATDSEITLIQGALTGLDAFRFMPFGVMVLAGSLAMLQSRSFARWIAWVGVASGVLTLAAELSFFDPSGPIGNIGNAGQAGFVLFMIWTAAVSVALLRRKAVPAPVRQVGEPGTAAV